MIDSVNKMNKVVTSKIKNYSYKSNKKKESTDTLIKEYLIENLNKKIDSVVKIQDLALASQMLMIWGDVDRLINILRDLKLIILETDYEGTTFFISTKTFENNDLLIYDFQTMELLDRVDDKLVEFFDSVESALLGDISQHVSEILHNIREITNSWTERMEKIRAFKAF